MTTAILTACYKREEGKKIRTVLTCIAGLVIGAEAALFFIWALDLFKR